MELIFKLEEIMEVAKKVMTICANYKVFALYGEMGVGKTTFIHSACKVLKVKDIVSSPTFSIINEYKTINNEIIYHIDLYRIKNEAEAINAGVEDCLYSGNICWVEWPEKAPCIFPDKIIHITIDTINSVTRKLEINL